MNLQVDREGAVSDLCWHAVCKGLGRRINHASHCSENSLSLSLGLSKSPAWSCFHRNWGAVMAEWFLQPTAGCWAGLVTHMTVRHNSLENQCLTRQGQQRCCWLVGECSEDMMIAHSYRCFENPTQNRTQTLLLLHLPFLLQCCAVVSIVRTSINKEFK